uniref:DNA-directed RNA polymerase n=1 Tax=Halimeda discoidea TaxID=118222 RepID=A0A1C9JAZ5_9CHLO|nr:RNA polymerase b2-subunit [Halimeda discoidea]
MTTFFNYCFDKRRFSNFLQWFFRQHGHQKVLHLLEKLKSVGFQSATQAGFSISIEDLQIPELKSTILFNTSTFQNQNLTPIENYQKIIELWNFTNETLKVQVIQSFEISDFFNPVYLMAFSGARGNISQVRQLVSMRGLMADPQGQIIDFPIRSNFREGLTLTEYLISCSGARKGIVDTALRTAASGYLTRRLVDVAHHVIISQIDCSSKKGFLLENLYDKKKKILSLEQRLVGRILAEKIVKIGDKNQEITKSMSKKICNSRNKVLIRSPLTCLSSKFICQLCYGWNLAEGQLVSIGEAVGILAAQSIGEPGTQLTMRTFHTGGVFTGTILDQTHSPCGGQILYPFFLNGLLIRTQQGQVAYLTKNSGTLKIQRNSHNKKLYSNIERFLNFNAGQLGSERKRNLFLTNLCLTITKSKKDYSAIFFIFQNSTILYVRQGEYIRKHQLLAEVPFLNTEAYLLEKEQAVLAPVSGEIYFDVVLFEKTRVDLSLSKIWILFGHLFPAQLKFTVFQKLDIIAGNYPINQIELFDTRAEREYNTKFQFKKINYYFRRKFGQKDWQFFFNEFEQNSNLNRKFIWTNTSSNSSYVYVSAQGFLKKKQNLSFVSTLDFSWNKFRKKISQTAFTFMHPLGAVKIENFLLSILNLLYLNKYQIFINWSKNWTRAHLNHQPKIIHWKDLPLQKYIFLINFINKKFDATLSLSEAAAERYSFGSACRNFSFSIESQSIGFHCFIRIPLYLSFAEAEINNKKIQLNKKFNLIKFFIENQFPPRDSATPRSVESISLASTSALKGSLQNNFQNLYLQQFKWNFLTCSASAIKIASKTLNKYFDIHYFLLKNFINFRNCHLRFIYLKPQSFCFQSIVEKRVERRESNSCHKLLSKNRFLNTRTPKSFQIIQKKYSRSKRIQTFVRFFKYFENSEVVDLRVAQKKMLLSTMSDFFCQTSPKISKLGALIQNGQTVAQIQDFCLYRKTTNYLLSNQSIFYSYFGKLISQNERICTVFYSQPKTGDIVQGIPKIEQILEVRSPVNSPKSVVNNIQRIYGGQGIYISDKHIEIIVRQMTSNALILDPGPTGLLCGEIVAIQWIERINADQAKASVSKKVLYEPIFMGMTRTCLEMSTFLSAASFQETTRVLSQAALKNQIDFVRGIKQNVILGNLIPIGTGVL